MLSSPFLLSFILLLIIATLTAIYAQRIGRNPLAWFILALLFSFLAPIVLFLLPSIKDIQKTEETDVKKTLSPASVPSEAEKEYQEQTALLKEDNLWYYLDNHRKQFGPISLIGIRELWDRGQISLSTYFWSQGMKEWERLEKLPLLHEKILSSKKML
jgi:hypothetical protein